MISFLKGHVTRIDGQIVTLVLNQVGIGFDISVPSCVIVSQGKEVSFYIYSHWNADQGLSLFGFENLAQKQIFELVISCSGIGPKIGLAVLSQMEPKTFIKAIAEQDVKALSSINGIGAKKAEQMIVQLKHKIASLFDSDIAEENHNYKHIKNVGDVLTSLNYSRTEISKAVDHLRNNCLNDSFTFDQMLRQALSFLSKKV